MKLLVLGGTRFLGRHLVEAAVARGHEVTVFTRGRLPLPPGGRIAALVGDRDPRNAPGLAALDGGTWDAVVDTSGYVPRIVDASAAVLVSRVRRYLFVSSESVYSSTAQPGVDENSDVLALADPATEDVPTHYGALKAACEECVRSRFGARATIVRPGLIVGPHDPTDRFGYWVARFVHPQLLGDRAPRAVVPAPAERPIQFIDARDLALFMLGLLGRDIAGRFNADSPPGRYTMGQLIDTLVAASLIPPEPVWRDDAALLAAGVQPWTGLPLWLPASEPDAGGFFRVSTLRAEAAGLACRPLASTIADTAAWLLERPNADAWKIVISASAERTLA